MMIIMNLQVQRASTLLAEASPGKGAATGVLRQASLGPKEPGRTRRRGF